MVDSEAIARARAVPIQHELRRRGVKLRPSGHELVGPCPVCGGTDRFNVHLRKQIWLCRRCPASGDVIALVQHLDGVGFADAVALLTGEDRPAPVLRQPPPPPAADSGEDARQRALALWWGAVPIAGTLAEKYLIETRKLALPPDISPRALRFHPDVHFGKGCPFGPARHPALLALFRDILTDEPRAVHRIALTADGGKIGSAMLAPAGGAAIKLSDDVDATMGLAIGEGIETVLAGVMKDFTPAWALGSAGAIAAFPVLSGIEALTIFVDNDRPDARGRRAGPECAYACGEAWRNEGREVFYVVPDVVGQDMADLVRDAS